ncbi:MAG: helix-turn-helix domain-containing protein [bacterium]
MTKLCISVPEAARLLGLGRNSVYEAVGRGEVPAVRIGRRLVVPIRALEAWLESQVQSAEARA